MVEGIKDLEKRIRERVAEDGQYIVTLNMAKFLEEDLGENAFFKIRKFLEKLGEEYTKKR